MIEVLHSVMYCSVQDKGRFGVAKQGIPQAGYLDSSAAALANVLLKNNEKDAVLEITFGQGTFKFKTATYICITGANFSPKLNGQAIAVHQVYYVAPDTVLSFGKRMYGARTYVAVQGGIQSEIVLGSRSFSFSITPQTLSKGALLAILPIQEEHTASFSKVRVSKTHFTTRYLPCFKGPEYAKLTKEQQVQLAKSFTISEDNNRVGYRLQEPLENKLSPILTAAVLPGTVQLTPSGKCIVLLQDCQVTGGYPRILQLSEIAMARISQKIAGDTIQFVLED
tara:strand:- start:147 stop:989 length:843 start_codon:yes stop_codon:yes gene_type:complete